MIPVNDDPKPSEAETPEQDQASVDPDIPVDLEEPAEPGDGNGQPG